MVDSSLATGLSAQHLVGEVDENDDGSFVFCISDDEELVEISHEIGDAELAARKVDELADRLKLYAERIRGSARAEVSWT